jgi:hypothetical protein
MAAKKEDPTVTSMTGAPDYPEGTHPARPVSETTFGADKLSYKDMPADMKPDPSTIAQIQDVPEGWPTGQ